MRKVKTEGGEVAMREEETEELRQKLRKKLSGYMPPLTDSDIKEILDEVV